MLEKPTLNAASGLMEAHIDGKVIQITPWPTRIWTDRYILLMAVAGEFLARGVAAANFGRPMDENAVGLMAEALMRNLGKDRKISLELIEALCSQLVFMDGRPVNFNSDFNRKPMFMHRVLRAAVVVQFGPLFEEMRAELEAADARLTSQQEKTSSEGSGFSSPKDSEPTSTSTNGGPSPTT